MLTLTAIKSIFGLIVNLRSKERNSVIGMAMTVRYNGSANRALNNYDKNSKVRSKSLAKVASGMKINSAQDDAASFSISSRMRVKLRALEQDAQNVQNGSSILRTAEGGIQGQIEILRTIREKVIDAANDHNTDEDRQTIQKELVHLYDEIESLAYGTDFNSKKPLLADKIIKLDEGDLEEIRKTKLNLITNAQYKYLDNVYGPFDIFTEYSSTMETVPFQKTQDYQSGTLPTKSIDFSGYSDVSDLNNVGINIGGSYYVFTDDTSKKYRAYNDSSGKPVAATAVLLGADIDETINNLKSKVGGTLTDKTLTLQTSVSGVSGTAYTHNEYAKDTHEVTKAGVSGTTSGGTSNPLNDPDYPPALQATLTVDLSGAADDSGFVFNQRQFRVVDSGSTPEGDYNVKLTKGTSASGSAGNGFSYSFDGSNLTFTANNTGEGYNGYRIFDRYTYTTQGALTSTTNYTAYNSFNASAITTVDAGTPATPAIWEYDLTGMTVDDFSSEYAGKTFNGYKLYDSYLTPKVGSIVEDSGSREISRTQIDINDIRQAVNGGKSLAQAIAERLTGGTVDGDKIKFERYNNYTLQMNIQTETLRHYDIDFSNLGVKIPDDLYGKGFRAYCATDSREWFNFIFTDGTDSYDTDKENIKYINIDVSAVTNATQLVKAIYTQGNALLTGDDPKYNHHMRFAVDPDTKIVTLYDHRRVDVSGYPDYQEMGAKIADGISFKEDYEREKRNFSVKDLVIQHTDKAGMNIHIQIPQMTLDHIFDPLPEADKTIFDYPVTDKDSRDALLGKPKPPGILDHGLKYLLDAVTTVGAQNRRLEFTAENISTETENLTASESTIRDADMAKEMTEYTKYNLLAQASQSMLAQANQSQSMALSLLE